MQAGNVQRQHAVEVVLEVEANLQRAFDGHLFDVGEHRSIAEAALGGHQLEGVAHVFGGDGLAVLETRLGVEEKTNPQTVGVHLHLFRDQAIHRVRLIQRAIGQWRVHPAVDLAHIDALIDVGIEVIELADFFRRPGQRTTLGGVRVDVIEVLEAGRVFRCLAIDGQGVGRRRQHCLPATAQRNTQKQAPQKTVKTRHGGAFLVRTE